MTHNRFTKAARIAAIGLILSLTPSTFAQTGGSGAGGTGSTGGTSTGAGSSGGASMTNTGTGRDDGRGFDWGWLGLLGLVGLAGLRRPHTNDGRERRMKTAHA
jgi:MYXO-CTERM domain-containing protein